MSTMQTGRASFKTKGSQYMRKHPVTVRTTAVFLAAALAFSAFFANVSSIVDVLTVKADGYTNQYIEAETYYPAGLTLYDYIDDNNTPGKNSQVFHKFNTVLYRSAYPNMDGTGNIGRSYVQNATYTQEMDASDGTTVVHDYAARQYGTGTHTVTIDEQETTVDRLNTLLSSTKYPSVYFPLYLGLQYAGSPPDPEIYKATGTGTESAKGDPTKYNYNLSANANAGSTNSAAQGLVNSKLTDGLVTQGKGSSLVTLPYFNEKFLTTAKTINVDGTSTSYTPGTVYKNKKFRFRKHTSGSYNGYYVYDSRYDGLVRDDNASFAATNTYTVVTHGTSAQTQASNDNKYERYADETSDTSYGFFPLGQYNFGFGAKFDIQFTMTEDGLTPAGKDMVFNFSGDDDVWVFIDDELVLDLGGAHGRVAGKINFAKATATVDCIKNASNFEYSKASSDASDFDSTKTPKDISTLLDSLRLYDDPTKSHTLTVFYLERGRNNSNCMITFNFEQADTLTVQNNVNYDHVNDAFLEKTKTVAEAEGIEYLLKNNGVATTQDGPDDDADDLNVELRKNITDPEDAGKYTIHYMVPKTSDYQATSNVSSDDKWTDWKQVEYSKDKSVRLRFDATRSHWDLRGWTSEKKGDDYTGTVLKKYYLDNSSTTTDVYLYSVWDYEVSFEGAIPLPLVVIFRRQDNGGTRYVYEGSIYTDQDIQLTKNGSWTRNPFKEVASDTSLNTYWFFANYTNKANLTNTSSTWNNWWKVRYAANDSRAAHGDSVCTGCRHQYKRDAVVPDGKE